MASKAANQPAKDSGEQALATFDATKGQLPAALVDEMSGQTDFGHADLSIPFLRIIQGLSPQIQPADPKYIKGAAIGQILENVTPKVFDGTEGICVIPVMYNRSYTEWKPNRGGFVEDHGSDMRILDTAKTEENSEGKKRLVLPNGNDLAEAAQYFVLWAEEMTGPWEPAILAMAGTQWRTARDWNTNMGKVRLTRADGSLIKNPLPFACIYHLSTVAQKKDNYNFYGWKVQNLSFTLAQKDGESLVRECIAFRKMVQEGRVKGVQDEAPAGDDVDTAFNANGTAGSKEPF